jgi:hypothetical protein
LRPRRGALLPGPPVPSSAQRASAGPSQPGNRTVSRRVAARRAPNCQLQFQRLSSVFSGQPQLLLALESSRSRLGVFNSLGEFKPTGGFAPEAKVKVRGKLSSCSDSESESDLFTGTIHVIPTATYSFVPPGCRRGRLAAAFPRPRVSSRLAPASAWAVWPRSLPPVCSLPRVCCLSIAILSRLHTILGALTLRRRPAVTPSSARTSLEQRSLSPGVTAPLSWSLPIGLPPLARHRARRLYLHHRRRTVTIRQRSRTLHPLARHQIRHQTSRSHP